MTAAMPKLRRIFVTSENQRCYDCANNKRGKIGDNSKEKAIRAKDDDSSRTTFAYEIFVAAENSAYMAAFTAAICTLWE